MSEKPVEREEIRKHRAETWAKIVLPVVLVTLLVVGFIVWMVVTTSNGSFNPTNASGIATIWLMIPLIFMFLIGSAILVLMIIVAGKLSPIISKYVYTASMYNKIFNLKTKTMMDKAADIGIGAESRMAGFRTILSNIRHPGRLIQRGEKNEEI